MDYETLRPLLLLVPVACFFAIVFVAISSSSKVWSGPVSLAKTLVGAYAPFKLLDGTDWGCYWKEKENFRVTYYGETEAQAERIVVSWFVEHHAASITCVRDRSGKYLPPGLPEEPLPEAAKAKMFALLDRARQICKQHGWRDPLEDLGGVT